MASIHQNASSDYYLNFYSEYIRTILQKKINFYFQKGDLTCKNETI